MGKMGEWPYIPCWLWRHGCWCLLSLLGCLLFFALVCVLFSFIGLVPASFSRRCLCSYGVALILLKGDTVVFDPHFGSLGSLPRFGLSDWVLLDTELLVSLPQDFSLTILMLPITLNSWHHCPSVLPPTRQPTFGGIRRTYPKCQCTFHQPRSVVGSPAAARIDRLVNWFKKDPKLVYYSGAHDPARHLRPSTVCK